MSARVMAALREFTDDVEVYSIDEAFVDLRRCRRAGSYRDLGVEIREKVLRWTGVPVTVGIAATKTLAKVANHIAKTSHKAAGVRPETARPSGRHFTPSRPRGEGLRGGRGHSGRTCTS